MNSFSIAPYGHQQILDSYQQWLVDDLYRNSYYDNLNDPVFLQKLSLVQAECVRHDIGLHAAVTHDSIQSAGASIGAKIQSAASLISSSLDDGFMMMNTRMVEVNKNLGDINQGIGLVNQSIQQGNQLLTGIEGGIRQTNRGINQLNKGIQQANRGIDTLVSGVDSLNRNLVIGTAIVSSSISQAASLLQYQLKLTNNLLQEILNELKIPESQRERRYHIEQGIKFFNKGIKSGDFLYFEDALDEFTKAISIERKDFFSWYYTGMIYLYSKEHVDPEKALSAFDRYIHYAEALSENHELYNEALIMKAECKYLLQDSDAAYDIIRDIINVSDKAALRGMKYLSASANGERKQKAVDILDSLVKKNPYVIMQVLEDYDLVCNNYIIEYLEGYKQNLLNEMPIALSEARKEINDITKFSIIVEDLNSKLERYNKGLYTFGGSIVELLIAKDELHELLEYAKILQIRSYLLRDGMVKFKGKNGYWGYMDEMGNEAIPCQFVSAEHFSEGLACVTVRSNYKSMKFIDKTGRVVISTNFDYASNFEGGVATVSKWEGVRSCHGMINKSGQLIVPCQWESVYNYLKVYGYIEVVSHNGERGAYDINGKQIIPCKWKALKGHYIKDGYAIVKDFNDKWGALSTDGRLLVSCRYDNPNDFYIRKNYKGEFEVKYR